MERPSHISLQSPHRLSSRMGSLGVAVLVPLAILWGLANNKVIEIIPPGPLHYVPDRDKPTKPQQPPLPVKMQTVTQPVVTQPVINIAQPADNHTIVTQPLVESGSAAGTAINVAPDRAVTGILSTHTRPPYPPLAQRLGEQGQVSLRLTVLADGRVSKADIVSSSGSSDLDQAAQQWVVAHWLYKPALDKGQPVASQAQAVLVFNLAEQR